MSEISRVKEKHNRAGKRLAAGTLALLATSVYSSSVGPKIDRLPAESTSLSDTNPHDRYCEKPPKDYPQACDDIRGDLDVIVVPESGRAPEKQEVQIAKQVTDDATRLLEIVTRGTVRLHPQIIGTPPALLPSIAAKKPNGCFEANMLDESTLGVLQHEIGPAAVRVLIIGGGRTCPNSEISNAGGVAQMPGKFAQVFDKLSEITPVGRPFGTTKSDVEALGVVVMHELGHTFGLAHAAAPEKPPDIHISRLTQFETIDIGKTDFNKKVSEYGDANNMMAMGGYCATGLTDSCLNPMQVDFLNRRHKGETNRHIVPARKPMRITINNADVQGVSTPIPPTLIDPCPPSSECDSPPIRVDEASIVPDLTTGKVGLYLSDKDYAAGPSGPKIINYGEIALDEGPLEFLSGEKRIKVTRFKDPETSRISFLIEV